MYYIYMYYIYECNIILEVETMACEDSQLQSLAMDVEETASTVGGDFEKVEDTPKFESTVAALCEQLVDIKKGEHPLAWSPQLEGVLTKESNLEMRAMYARVEVAETIRQMVTCLTVYDHDRAGLEWFAGIFVRELSKLEVIHRKSKYPP